MATATWTLVFAADAESLADQGVSANLAFAYNGGEGSPSTGCVGFVTTTDSLTGEVERGRKTATGDTWESKFGIAAGSIVTAAQITAMKEKVAVDLGSDAATKIRIVNSSAATVHSAGELYSASYPAGSNDISFNSKSGSSRAVDSSYQASNTDIRLELEATVNTGAGPTSINLRYDTIEITITYTPPTAVAEIMAVLVPRSYPVTRSTVRDSLPQQPSIGVLAVTRLYFANLPDERGAVWRTEVIASESADPAAAAVVWTGNLYVAIYSDRNQVMVARSGNPLNWADAVRLNTGLTGRVYGAAMNDAGVICALIGSKWYLSRDHGLTWVLGGTGGWPLPAAITAVRHQFVVMGPTGATPKHWVSVNCGVSFL